MHVEYMVTEYTGTGRERDVKAFPTHSDALNYVERHYTGHGEAIALNVDVCKLVNGHRTFDY